MLKNKLKIITHIGASSFSVAALAETHHPTDTDFNRFAFIVYGIDIIVTGKQIGRAHV